MTIEIRPVIPADHAAWLPLWLGYLDFYQSALPTETSAVTWQRFLDPSEPTHAALAWRGDQAVGLVQWIFHRSNWSVENSCYLQDLFVAADTRRTGTGRRLIEHVYAQARGAGALADPRKQRQRHAVVPAHRRALRLYPVPQEPLKGAAP